MNNISKRTIVIGLITISLVLIAGLVLGIVLKFNTNYEVGGYSEFVVDIDSTDKATVNKSIDTIKEIIDSNDLKYDTTLTIADGAGTRLIVRYLAKARAMTIALVNGEINGKLELGSDDITHTYFDSKLNQEVAHTSIILAILVVCFSIFATIRYRRFAGLVSLISAIIGTALYLSITAILRLTVGMSYFALLIVLNLVIMYYEIGLFERVGKSDNIIEKIALATNANKKSMSIFAIGIAIVSLLFVIIAPTSLKFVSIDLMFIPVVCLTIGLYVAPYLYMLFGKLFTKNRAIKSK